MPRDAEIFRQVTAGQLAGCLRIYNWDEPALTLGYNQARKLYPDASEKWTFSSPTTMESE